MLALEAAASHHYFKCAFAFSPLCLSDMFSRCISWQTCQNGAVQGVKLVIRVITFEVTQPI